MKYSNSIEYNISTKLDKSGLTQLQTQIKQVELTMQQMANKELLNPTKVQNAREQLQGLSTALNKAFNPSLGMLDLAQFRKELSNSKVTAEGLQSAFRLTGAQGAQAFSSLAKQIGHFNSGMERTSSAVDKMFVTFQNTFRWGLISSFFSQFMNAIHSSVQYAKDLDDSLTQIMLVTDYSRDSMNEYAKAANEAAKAVGQTTVGMTNASLIFAQQGYDLDQSQQLATLSAKLANASQQDTAATSDQITAYMNAYGLQNSMDELVQAMDNWAKIANISAADVEEIALASQRAASMANAVGVSGEALAAQIATIESVTREAPEQIGNGLKTLYARFSDLKLGKDDEDGIGLGKVTSTLQQIGVQVLDAFGNVRDMDDIMEDLMVVWQDLDDTSKTAAAQTLAGKHQVNRFMALMENVDMYQEYKGATGAGASGTLEEMNAEYLDSLQGRMTKLQSTLEGLFNDVFTTDMVYPLIDGLTKLAEAIDTLFKSVGGGSTIILGLASAFMKLFSTNIARSINDFASNQQLAETRKSNLANVKGSLVDTGLNKTEVGQYIDAGAERANSMNAEQYRIYEQQLDSYITASTNAAAANEKLNDTYLAVAAAAGMLYENAEDLIILDETGLNISGLIDEVAARNPKELAESFKNIDWKPAIEGAEELSKSMGRLGIAIDRAKKSEQDLDAVLQMGDKASDNLQILYETGAITSQTYDKLRSILDQTSLELAENGEVTEETTKDFEQATAVIARYAEALKNLGPETLAKGPEAIAKALRDQLTAQQALDQNRRSGQGVIQNLDNQLNVENIVKMTAAIGQLTFAWQSLGNLPSIWNDKDLTNSEKMLQTITNLSMAVPTLIGSFKPITGLNLGELIGGTNEFNEATKKASEASKTLAKAQEESKIASAALTVAQEKVVKIENQGAKGSATWALRKAEEAAASKIQAAATKELTAAENAEKIAAEKAAAAEKALNAARMAAGIMIAVMAIMAIVSAIQKWRAEQQALFQERLDASNEQVENAKKELDNVEELYETWKKTGEGADELRQALEDQAEALGIVVTAADDYETLKQKIEEATAAQLAYNAALRQENEEAPTFSVTPGMPSQIRENLGLGGVTVAHGQTNMGTYDTENFDYAQAYETAQRLRQERQEELLIEQQKLAIQERSTDEGEAAYQATLQRVNALQAEINEYDRFIQANQEAIAYDQETAENIVYGQALKSNSIFSFASQDEALQYVRNLTEGLALTEAQQRQLAIDALEYAGNLEAAADAQWALAQYQVNQNTNIGSEGEEYHLGQQGLDTINYLSDTYGFSDEQKTSILEMFDWSDPDIDANVAALARRINEGLAQGLTLDEILNSQIQNAGNAFDPNVFQYTDEQIAEIMKKAGLEDVSLDDYVQTFKDMGGAGIDSGEINTVREHIDDLTASLEREREALREIPKNTPEYDEQVKQIKEMQNELDQANEHLEHLAISALETSNGLDELSSRWNDISDAINNSASPGELTATYTELRNILAQILNVDPSAITQSFMESANVLESLGRLAEGDLTAINDLRAAFAEPLNIRTYLDTIGFEGDIATLLGLVDQAQAALPDLEVGAYLEDEQFLNALTEMVMSGQIAAEDIKNIFEGLGYDVQVHYDTEMTFPNVVAHMEARKMTGADDMAMETAYSALDHSVTDGTTVQVPRFEFTPKGGGGGGHNFRKNTGGSGGGKGGGCFVAGTLVSLQNQFKNIEDIQIGDIVLSYNEEIHQNEYSIVLQTMIHDVTEEIYDLYIEDEILTVTGIHRFYIRRKHDIEWISASDLHIGDYVLFADGNWHPIFKIKVKIRSLLVYNFEVSHNHNYYVGRNQILAHNKGGGGGGGKAKTIQPKEKKEHKKDYYERVNSELDKLKEQLSGIEKQEDRLIGDKARANQAKQIALIRKEIDLEKDRLRILQDTKDSELKDVRAAITAKDTAAQDILKGRGIKFDIPNPEYDPETGIITNYEKISEKIDEAHNKLIDQYNAAAKAGNEDLTKTIEEAIKKYDDYSGAILENVQRQNDIQKEIESTKNTIQELEDSIEDIQIELYKASMEAIDNLKDLNEKWAEFEGFLTGMPTDSPFRDLTVDLLKLNSTFEIGKEDAAKYYQEIIDGKIAAQNATTDQAEKEAIQASINYFVGLRDGLTDDMLNNGLLGLAMEDLKQLEKWYKDPSLKDNPFGDNQKALVEVYQEGYERVLELSQDWQDLQEDIIDSVIDGYDEIADKQDRQLGKYTRLADQLEQLADNYALSYGDESYQALSDIGKQQGETLRAQLQQYKEIYKYWQEQYQEALKTGNKELINSIEDHMNDAEDEMRDIANEAAETFVDAYEKAIDAAIQKMNKTLIGETDFDRLDRNWEWQDKMIEGYLDDVEKAYEIEKLRGDYMDMLNEAQGASLATQNKIRAAMNEQLQLLEDQTTVSQFDVDLANARLLVLQKQIALEDAQRNKNQMQLRRDSQGNYRYVYRANQDEIAKARKELLDAEREVYKMSQDHMKEVRQNVADAINEFIDQWRTISTDPNLSEDQRKEQLEELVNNIKPILAVYAEDLKNGSDGIAIALGDMINSSTDEMATAASDMLSKIYNEEGNLAEKTGTLWWDVVTKFTNEIFPNIDSAIATLATTTYGEMDQLRNNLTGPDGVIPDVTDALVGEDGFRPALIAAADAITNEDPTKGLNAAMKSLGDSLEAENTKLKEGINNITNYTTALAGAITTLSQAQGAITDLQKITLDNVVYQFKAEVQDNTQNASPNIEAASYDTGGYTGDWGEDGKIAILHQKELILNAEDTRNILSAVDIVRQMTSTLGNALTNYSIGSAKNSLMNSAFGAVDQRVEIKAEFPNVRDAFEIETALTNLADKAYQYAHRKI